jgi:hypothetical protein
MQGLSPSQWGESSYKTLICRGRSVNTLTAKLIPRASERVLDALGRGDQNGDFAGLDSLDAAQVKIHLFGQFLPGKPFVHPFAADVLAELIDESGALNGQSSSKGSWTRFPTLS